MAESYLLDKLKSVEQTFNELTRRMADPDVAKEPNEFQRVAKARSSLEEVVNTFELWKETQENLAGAKQILKESASDPEMQEIASLEVRRLARCFFRKTGLLQCNSRKCSQIYEAGRVGFLV